MLTQSAPSTFGDLLRQHRQTAGLTQQELAERAGLSVHGIQKLERGATRPYRDTAQRLIVALQLGADDRSRLQAAVMPVRRHSSAPQVDRSGEMRHNLPSPTTSLVGREGATVEIRRRLAETRLLTLTGVGGCGKTRLALEVARAVVEDYSDGVWLVELGPLVDPSLVPQRVAAALEVREKAEEPLTTALANAMRRRHLLLVLDNCEHLLDACAQLVDDLLKACPGLSVLATSREPIGVGGEMAWRVPSLGVPEAESDATPEQLLCNPAVQLFVQRAIAAQARFALTTRNASAVVQICRRLDGIPLALELAAARVEALTAQQIALRLDQRFQLLTGGSRAALPRQQTLAATLDWSYDLLGTPERQLLERLAVFSGGWTLEAAETVCPVPTERVDADGELNRDEVVDVLAHLTRKSLVVADETADGAERYSLLETVQDYARQKLASRAAAEITALRDRHAEFYISFVQQLLPEMLGRSPVEARGWDIDAVRQVDTEYDNVRAVLNWCLESNQPAPGIRLALRLFAFWTLRGLESEARRWLVALVELADRTARDSDGKRHDTGTRAEAIGPADRALAITALGLMSSNQGDYREGAARCAEAAAMWRGLGDDLRLGIMLQNLGLLAWLQGIPAEAVEHLNESRRVFEQCERTSVTIAYVPMPLRGLGLVARSRGDYAVAAEYFRESVIQARLGGDHIVHGYNLARGLCNLGRTLFLQGDVAQAKQLFSEALGVMQAERLAGHTLADCLDWLAAVADTDGRPREAAVLFGAAEAQWHATGIVRYAPERAAYAAELARVQEQLAADEFAAAWAEGHAMSREQAIKYALEVLSRMKPELNQRLPVLPEQDLDPRRSRRSPSPEPD